MTSSGYALALAGVRKLVTRYVATGSDKYKKHMISLANNHAKLKYLFYVESDFRLSTYKIGEPDRSEKKNSFRQ